MLACDALTAILHATPPDIVAADVDARAFRNATVHAMVVELLTQARRGRKPLLHGLLLAHAVSADEAQAIRHAVEVSASDDVIRVGELASPAVELERALDALDCHQRALELARLRVALLELHDEERWLLTRIRSLQEPGRRRRRTAA